MITILRENLYPSTSLAFMGPIAYFIEADLRKGIIINAGFAFRKYLNFIFPFRNCFFKTLVH